MVTTEVPSLRALPIVGHSIERIRDPLGFYERIHKLNHSIIGVSLMGRKMFVVSDPRLIKAILLERTDIFVKGRSYDGIRKFTGKSVFTTEGNEWLIQRKALSPLFQNRSLEGFIPVFEDCISRRMIKLKNGGPEFDLRNETVSLTLEIIVKTMFGIDATESFCTKITQLVDDSVYASILYGLSPLRFPDVVPTPLNRKIAKINHGFEKLVNSAINQTLERKTKQNDLIQILLDSRKADGERLFDDERIKDTIITMILAGHDTTASTIVWALWHLGADQSLQERVLSDESDQTIKALILEVLRLYPPAWALSRELTEDIQLGGYDLKKNSNFIICPYSLHRDENLWENPNQFNIDRHFEATKANRYQFLPFSFGPRVCIGEAFSMTEMIMFIRTFVKTFQFSQIKRGTQRLNPQIMMRPDGQFKLAIKERSYEQDNRNH